MPVYNPGSLSLLDAQTNWEGKTLFVDGHSIPLGSGATIAAAGYVAKLVRRLSPGATTNHSVSGVTAAKTLQSQTYTAGYAPGSLQFAYLWDGLVNDASQGGVAAKALAKFANAIRYTGAVLRADSNSAPTLSPDGSFLADVVNSVMPGLNGTNTITQNGTMTINFATSEAGRQVVILLAGSDDSAAALAGAAFEVRTLSDSVGETVVSTGTLSDQFFQGSDAQPRGVYAVVTTLPTGANPKVKIKKTDATGPILRVAQAAYHKSLLPVGTAGVPVSVFVKQPYTSAAANSTVDTYNALVVSTLTALGGYGTHFFIADPSLQGFVSATHTADGLHPNDQGHTMYANAVAAAMMQAARYA